jgi:hypothetical protein
MEAFSTDDLLRLVRFGTRHGAGIMLLGQSVIFSYWLSRGSPLISVMAGVFYAECRAVEDLRSITGNGPRKDMELFYLSDIFHSVGIISAP